ncbi:hypothetical protein FKM82_014619 [Ascaphus truei]
MIQVCVCVCIVIIFTQIVYGTPALNSHHPKMKRIGVGRNLMRAQESLGAEFVKHHLAIYKLAEHSLYSKAECNGRDRPDALWDFAFQLLCY